jgi:hypothetical protein
MRNAFLINVFQQKCGNKRCHEEDKRNQRDVLDPLVALRLHEVVQPDRDVNYANDEEEPRECVEESDLVELDVLEDFEGARAGRFDRRLG